MARHSCSAVTRTDPKPEAFLDYGIPEDTKGELEGSFTVSAALGSPGWLGASGADMQKPFHPAEQKCWR